MNNFDHGIYGFALPQVYGEVAMGDLSVKMGHFFTIIGYEVVTAPDNFFLQPCLYDVQQRAVHSHRRAGHLQSQ